MIVLPRLRPGDLVGVASLSGPADPAALAIGEGRLVKMGYRVRLAPNLTAWEGTLGLAGSDAERLRAYRELLHDEAVNAILFARGGYGCRRALVGLDPAELRAHPKIHCGFSDLTVLSALLLREGIPSFHGPMVAADLARNEREPITEAFFPSALEGRGPREIAFAEGAVLVPGNASGRLVGGCLSILAGLVGGPDEFDYDDAILFFEDIAEEAYRIDRMLETLIRAGRFAKLRGILIGALTAITFRGVEDEPRLRRVLEDRLTPLGIPVAMGLPAGHRGPNAALPVGARVTWDGGARVLRFEEEIVA